MAPSQLIISPKRPPGLKFCLLSLRFFPPEQVLFRSCIIPLLLPFTVLNKKRVKYFSRIPSSRRSFKH